MAGLNDPSRSVQPCSTANPEDEYADEEYADHAAEEGGQTSTPADIPGEEPEEDVLEQRQEVLYREDDR
jgi:hypothetical protein